MRAFVLNNRIRDYRLALNLTVDDLASLVGVSSVAIYAFENGSYSPSAFVAYNLCCVFGCFFEDLFFLS